ARSVRWRRPPRPPSRAFLVLVLVNPSACPPTSRRHVVLDDRRCDTRAAGAVRRFGGYLASCWRAATNRSFPQSPGAEHGQLALESRFDPAFPRSTRTPCVVKMVLSPPRPSGCASDGVPL